MGIFNKILFLMTISLSSCKEYMPVLMWSNHASEYSHPVVSAFSKLTSSNLNEILSKKVMLENPLILVFMEENLSMEDFSWTDIDGNGAYPSVKEQSSLANDVTFFPYVQDPMRALSKLKHNGYKWRYYNNDESFFSLKDNENVIYEVKLIEPEFMEDRPNMLRKHDKQIAEIYKKALKIRSNVLAIYSGNHTSWFDAELNRYKREDNDTGPSTDLIISDADGIVRMVTTPPIIFEKKEAGKDPEIIKIFSVSGTPTINNETGKVFMTVKFPYKEKDIISVKFDFSYEKDEWWTLNSAEVQTMKEKNLMPSVDVGAPALHSFFCNPTVSLSNGNVSLTFENFQAQPGVGKKSFGPILHCIPYFSIAIWSGLIVVFILSVVLAWGIVMIMDINTNDRFDDPKGKTITISATD